jgi:hypothetical protein
MPRQNHLETTAIVFALVQQCPAVGQPANRPICEGRGVSHIAGGSGYFVQPHRRTHHIAVVVGKIPLDDCAASSSFYVVVSFAAVR